MSPDVLLGFAAALTSIMGVFLTVYSLRSGRKDATRKAEEECHQKLLAEQRVSEQLSGELHQIRMSGE